MYTYEKQDGGDNILMTGKTSLVDALMKIQEQLDVGLIDITGVSSISVVGYVSSPGYAQILAAREYLSSMLIKSVYNEDLLSDVLAKYGYSTISDYQRNYTDAIQNISHLRSTAIGLKGINDLSGSAILPFAQWQFQVAQIEYGTDAAAYSTIVYSKSSLNSLYISNLAVYSAAVEDYIRASTLEYNSTSTLTQEYTDILNARWSTIQTILGSRWVNTNKQSGGGEVTDILATYSSIQLADSILFDISALNYYSTLQSTVTATFLEYKNNLSSYIVCDYSTIVSTYVENIMGYKDEILQCTTGKLRNNVSTMIGYSTLWLSASQGDSDASTNYVTSMSTYNYYSELINNLSAHIGELSTVYKSTLFSFQTWEQICSTNQTLVTFLQLEQAEVNAQSLFVSTNSLKTKLESMLILIAQGANIDSLYNSAQGTFQSLQQGGAASANDIQLMLNTVEVMYNNYSTIYASTTQSRAAAQLPSDTATIYANTLSTQIAICDARIAIATDKYDKDVLSSSYLSQQISLLNGYLSSYTLTSTITDGQVSSLYSTLYSEYTTEIQTLTQEKISTQYQISKCENSVLVSSVTVDTIYNTIEQLILRLQSLGYTMNIAQQGGRSVLDDSLSALSKADRYIKEISSTTLSYSGSETTGLIGEAAQAVSAATRNYNLIVKSIDDLQKAASSESISSGTYLNVRNAVQTLNTNAAKYYEYSQIIYGYSYSTSHFKYSNYLDCLRILSSQLTTNLLENRDEITKIQWISSQRNASVLSYGITSVTDAMNTYISSSSSGTVVATADFNTKIQTLSTNSESIRNYRVILQSFINTLVGEEFSRNYYLLCKSTFEGQEKYRLQQGIKPSDMMSAYDFDQLTLTYDVSIQNMNRYISYRQTMFTPFVNATSGIVNSLRPNVVYGLESVRNAIMPPPSHSITSSLLMEFAPVPPRVVFPKGGMPTTTLIDCPPPSDSDQSAIRTTTYPAEPTTTLDSVIRGVKGRYINISKNNGAFEILQVLVIDATGKNVAFGKPVSGTTTTANPILSAIVNGQYSADVPANFEPYFKYNLNPATVLQIDLRETYDITCIRYIKSAASSYDSRGLRFDILNSSSGASLKSATLAENTPIEDCDVRIDPDAKKYINPSRKGACGYMGRHITLSKPDGIPFTLSQVAVVSSKGINPAKGKPVKKDGGAPATSPITDGTYYSRPRTSCVYASKFEVDLGSEVDVIAVHLYGVSDGDQDLQGVVANLYTEDKLIAYVQTVTMSNKKQILDFRHISASFINPACKTDLLWPAYYGEAGIICRYIRLKKRGRLGFTKIKVVDKSGRDVALFKPVTATSEAVVDSRFLGVNDRNEAGPLSESYSSVSGDAEQSYEIDLERVFEICSITVFRCSDAPSLMNDVQIQIFGNNRAGEPSTQFLSPSGNTTIFYDTRYDPDEYGSSYATDSVSTSRSYATFGTLALTVEIPGYVSSVKITEGTGQNLFETNVEKTITYTSSSTTAIRFKNLREVNSVVVDSLPIGTRVILRDCDGYIVNNKTTHNFSTPTGVYRLADFRNPFQPPYIKNVAPMLPIAFKSFGTGWSDVKGTYAGIPPNGVAARYVKVMPPSANSSLYISQIIVIDSRGINVAFQKDTFTTDSAQVTKTSRAVDGVYEPKLDETTPTILSYENYICRTAANSFVSSSGTYWVVDLGEEYLINSVVYVGVEGRYADSVNTIIELFDATLNQSAIQVISTYVTVFGVDILDFRVNRNARASSPGSYLEVRPRQIAVGCSGCGLMAQYIRLKGTNIRISQIIAIDSTGKNQALYMPTYTNIDLENSYKLVDGKYYQKMENPIQGETEAYIMNGIGYVEVNFGQEVEIVSVFLIPTVETPILSNLTIQIYNKFRDTIATLNPAYNTRNFSNISLLSDSNSLVYPSATNMIGVSIIKKFADFKIQAGLMSSDVLSGENMPPLNFGCSTAPISASCAEELKVVPRFTRGPNGGIPTRYLRVYNVSKYVQVSQIMAYGADGTNYAYKKKATSESIFPGTYPAKVTDGLGGYYHNARTCADSYKSEGNLYGFLEIDLGESASSTGFEIVGLRCIFPSDNPGQNIGTRIHLLDVNFLVLAQYVVGNGISLYNSSKYEFEDLIIDYRLQPVATPIDKIIMPKIASLTGFGTTPKSPNGIAEVCGKIYVADTLANRILVNDGTTFSSSALLSYPTGLVSDGVNMYVASYGNGTIVKIPIGSPGSASVLCLAPKPYGLCLNEGTLYITSYGGSVSNYYTFFVGIVAASTCTVMHGGQVTTTVTPAALAIPLSTPVNFPSSIAHIGSNTLLISSVNDKCIYRVNVTSGATTKYIGSTGATISLVLAAPSAISYDAKTKVLFISDYVQNRIYSARIDPSKPYETENVAGNGKGGYSGDGAQGSLAAFDGPMNILYSSNKGYLYISDYNNRKVRVLNIYSQPAETIASTTTSPQWVDWTTTTLAAQTLTQSTLSSAQYVEAAITPTNFSTITSPSKITDVQSVTGITSITTYYFFNNSHYCCANGIAFKIGTATPIKTGLGTCHMTMDNGFLYLCDSVNKCIWKENSAGSNTFSKYIGTGAGVSITYSFVNIGYIGFDRRRRLYVVDGDSILRMNKFNNGLEKYVGGAATVYSTPDYGTKIKLDSPGAFTFDSQNNLIFVDYTQETVFKVADTNGMVQHICMPPGNTKNYVDQLKVESAFPVQAADTYNIRTPFGITVDSADNLYVTSTGAQQILKLIPNRMGTYSIDIVAGLGSIVNSLCTNTAAQDTLAKYAQLNNPTYIYFSGSEILFSEIWGKIRKITLETQTSQPITTILPYGPLSIVANYSRNTYNTSRLVGAACEKFGLMQNFNATSVCCDTANNVYFPDTNTKTIMKMDSGGNLSIFAGPFTTVPIGIANYNDKFIYVTDGAKIRAYSLLPITLTIITAAPTTTVPLPRLSPVISNISSLPNSTNFIFFTASWEHGELKSGFSRSYILSVTNGQFFSPSLSNYSPSNTPTNGTYGYVNDGSIKTVSVRTAAGWIPVKNIERYDQTKQYNIGDFVLFTDNTGTRGYILTLAVSGTGAASSANRPGNFTGWKPVTQAPDLYTTNITNTYLVVGISHLSSTTTSIYPSIRVVTRYEISPYVSPYTELFLNESNPIILDPSPSTTTAPPTTTAGPTTTAPPTTTVPPIPTIPTEYTLAGCSNIAISPVGFMYVTNTTNLTISIYNLKTGATTPRTISVTEATTIDSLCVDTDLNLYVGKTHVDTYKISKYDSTDAAQGTTPNIGYKVSGITYSNGSLYYLTNFKEATISGTTTTTFKSSLYKINGTSMSLAPIRLIGQDKQKSQACDGAYGNTTTLSNPLALCIDMNENVYIVDKVLESPEKTVILKNTTFTPLQDSLLYNITGTNAQGQIIPDMSAYLENFSSIQGICYDSVGNIYISDSGQNTISKIDLTGKLTNFAGLISMSGSYSGDDGSSMTARLNNPTDIKMSKSDILYIADTNNNAIRRVKIYDTGNFQIETYISNVLKPTALAIDSYENLYVVTGASTIAVISPITETLSTVVNTGFNVSALAVNNLDQVYYTGNGALRQLGSVASRAFTQPTGLAIDASNKIYVSDSAQNKVFSVVGATITPEIGNGESETAVNATEGLAENIYGSGVPPLTAAVSAPRALAVNSSRGLLVAQPTKVLLKPVVNYGTTFNCGITSGTLTITNTGSIGPLYLSQIVALDTTGTNILLNRSGASYLDGFYGCKGGASAFQIVSGTPLTIPISGMVTCILIYVGSTNKTRWNGASITFGSNTRYVTDITENPLVQYILLDYRTKTPACTPFINYVNKYKLQETSSPTTEPFRIQYVRYVRIVCTSTNRQMTMSRIYAIHGETGEDLLSGKIPYTNLSPSSSDIITLNRFTGSGGTQNFPSNIINVDMNFWIEYDLGDEYPIEQVIIQQRALSGTYNVTLYTSNRTQVRYPSTNNRLDREFSSVVVYGDLEATTTISGSQANITGALSATVNSIPYLTYNVQQNNLPTSISFTTLPSTTTSNTSPQLPVFIAYNRAGEEITRKVLTYSPCSLSLQDLKTLSYSFTPIIGLRRIRYIRASNPITGIVVFDTNGVNVFNGKRLTFASREIDLGQEYELIQFICTAPSTVITRITFLDAFKIQQFTANITTTIWLQASHIDLRTSTRFIALPTRIVTNALLTNSPFIVISSGAVSDMSLTGFIRGRYVRIENARPAAAFSIITTETPTTTAVSAARVNIYDIYGKNLMAGKPILTSSPSTEYGASWEIDLGEEYAIRDIIYSGSSTNAIAIYNRYRAESWRNYTDASMTAPLIPPAVPATTTGTAIRYIRIVGACRINHVAAIDTRGIDVAIWKPVRIVSVVTVSYNTFNGLYASDIVNTGATGDRLEIDLAMSYNINNIKVYVSSGSNPTVTVYNSEGDVVSFTVTFLTTISTALQPYPNWGIKARYIVINTLAANADINNLCVIDSLGRNLAFINSATRSNGTRFNFEKTYSTTGIALPTTYTELDLGQEHSITSVSVYSKYTGTPSLLSLPTADTSLQGASVTLMDAYYNRIPRTLAGLGSQYNNTWSLGTSLGPYYQSPPADVSVVSGTDGAVWKFNADEHILGTCVTGVSSVIAMVVASNDTIFYSSTNGVYKVATTDGPAQPGTPFIPTSSIAGPKGLCLSNDETQLWICGGSDNKVYVYNTTDGTLIKSYGGGNTGEGTTCVLDTSGTAASTTNLNNCSFNYPVDITIDNLGYVYVADRDNYLIRKIDSSTNEVSTLAGATVCEQKEFGSLGKPLVAAEDRMCASDGWVRGHSVWSGSRYECPPDTNFKIIRRYYGESYMAASGKYVHQILLGGPCAIKIYLHTDSYYYLVIADRSVNGSNKGIANGGALENYTVGKYIRIYNGSYNSSSKIVTNMMPLDIPRISVNFDDSIIYWLIDNFSPGTNPIRYSNKFDGLYSLFGNIGSASETQDGYMNIDKDGVSLKVVPTGITLAAQLEPGKLLWPGFKKTGTNKWPDNIAAGLIAKIGAGANIGMFCHRKKDTTSPDTIRTMYFHDKLNSKIRKYWTDNRECYCEAALSTTVPPNSFVLSKAFNTTQYTDSSIMNTGISITGTKYPATTNAALYPNGTQAADINNQYYTLPDRPFAGPYNNSTNLPLVDPTGQFFVTATFSENLDFSPPAQPIFTFTSVTNTSFVLTVTSFGADYATSYTYSLNGGASQTISAAGTATVTAPAQSYNSVAVRAVNINGSTSSLIRYVQLAPTAPVLTATNISAIVSNTYNIHNSNRFTVSNFTVPPSPSGGYTISYTFTLTNALIWDTSVSIGGSGGYDYLMWGENSVGDSYNSIMINIYGSNQIYYQSPSTYADFYRRVLLDRDGITNYTSGSRYTGGTVVIHNGKGYILMANSSSITPDAANSPWWKFAETTKTYTSSTNSITFDRFSLISGVNPTVTVVTNYVLGAIIVSSTPSAPLTITM